MDVKPSTHALRSLVDRLGQAKIGGLRDGAPLKCRFDFNHDAGTNYRPHVPGTGLTNRMWGRHYSMLAEANVIVACEESALLPPGGSVLFGSHRAAT